MTSSALGCISRTRRLRHACIAAALAVIGSMITVSVTRVSATTNCYNTGDSSYSSSTTEQVTICHNTSDEGLYYNVPAGWWSFVQQASATSTTSSATATFGSASTVNNTIIALVQADNGTTSSVTDNKSDTFTQQVSQTSGSAQLSVWTATVGTGATISVTGSFSASNGQINILEYSGVGAVDVSAHSSGTGTSASSGATSATTQTNDLVVGAVGASQSLTAGTGFTSRGQQTGSLDLLAEDIDGGAWGTTQTATATLGASGSWAAIAVAFRHSSYGQIEYNVQPMRTAPNTYHTVLHSDAQKLADSTNCPLDTNGVGIGASTWPSANTNPWPTPLYGVAPNPWEQYTWCVVGDSTKVASYNATGPSDTTPYTMGSIPSYALWGSETNALAANFYGNTTGASTGTLSAALTQGTQYVGISVNALPWNVGRSATLTIGTGGTTQNVTLAPWQLTTLSSSLSNTSAYTTLSVAATPDPLPPNTALTIAGQTITTSAGLTSLTSALTSGNAYTSLAVTALPFTVTSGTVITIGASGTNQAVSVSSTASAGSTSISVTSFTANANYATTTPLLAPNIPSGATTLPVNKFVPSSNVASGTGVMVLGIPQGGIVVPLNQFTANANYPVGTTITLQADQQGAGGAANPMTVAGPYYTPYNNNYYYTYLVGERKTDTNPTCPWVSWSAGACGWREVLMQARTTDFVNWQILTNEPTNLGGPWMSMSALNSTYYPIPVTDRNNNPIEGNYATTAAGVGGLLGSVSDVYSPADGVHTYRYFYEDHPNTGNWQSDLQIWNLYERDASTADSGAFDASGNIVWSAATLVASNVPGSGLMRVAKAHGANRWAILYGTFNGSNPTTDAVVEYSADMTSMTHSQWLGPLTHLLQNLPAAGSDYFNLQIGRQYGTGFASTNSYGLSKSYLDLVAQIDFMTDRDGNVSAPDAETPGWSRGGMITWTDFPAVTDNSTGQNSLMVGTFGAKVYRAGFDVSGNSTGDLAVNGTFNTQTLTGNAAYDGWTTITESGTNYPPSVINNSGYTTAVAGFVGAPGSTESVGGSGMYQSVLIPSGSHSATLKFSYQNACPAGGGDYQAAYAHILETNTNVWVYNTCDNSQTWKAASVDLSAYAGDHAYIYFQDIKVNTTNTAPVWTALACQTYCVSLIVT